MDAGTKPHLSDGGGGPETGRPGLSSTRGWGQRLPRRAVWGPAVAEAPGQQRLLMGGGVSE